MSATYAVREVGSSDLAAVCRIVNWAIENTNANFNLEPESVEDWRAKFEATRARYPWLVAERDGFVAGIAYAVPYKPRLAYAPTAEVSVYVDPTCFRQGVGRALYTELMPRLERADFHSLFAGIALPNDASERLHAEFGFERIGILRRAGRKFDAWHDVAFWQKLLRDASHAPQA